MQNANVNKTKTDISNKPLTRQLSLNNTRQNEMFSKNKNKDDDDDEEEDNERNADFDSDSISDSKSEKEDIEEKETELEEEEDEDDDTQPETFKKHHLENKHTIHELISLMEVGLNSLTMQLNALKQICD